MSQIKFNFRASRRNPAAEALRSIAPHLGFAFLFSAAVNVLFLASPLYMMQLYGRVLNSRSIETLASLSIALALALIAMAAADAARGRLLVRAGARVATRLGPITARAALAEGKGRVGPALEEVDLVRRFFGGGAAATLMDAPFTIFFLFVLFLLHPMLGLVATLGAAAILAVIAVSRLIEARRDRRIAEGAQAVARTEAGLGSDRGEIRALGLDRGLAERLAAEHDGVGSLKLAAGELSASVGATARFCRLAAHSAALATGAVLAIDGALAPSAMLAAAILAGRALGPIEALPGALRHARMARGALDGHETRLDRPAEAAPAVTGEPLGGATVEVRRLVAMPRGATRATLRSVSFTIRAGEVVSVAGASGSGKSTLLRCLAGAEPVKSGEIRIDGVDITAARTSALTGRIGWLPQDMPLYPGTVHDNIARFSHAWIEDVRRAARRAGALAAIDALPHGFETELEAGAVNLSPHLRQGVAFARALMGDPGIVLLDQPTAHMDAAGEVATLNAIRKLKADGVTVIVVSHKPVLATLADRIMLLDDGVIEVFEDRDTVLVAMRRQSLRAVTKTPAGQAASVPLAGPTLTKSPAIPAVAGGAAP